jgi:hypothetical protein
MSAIKITVLNRDGKILLEFPEPVPIDTSVQAFKAMYTT